MKTEVLKLIEETERRGYFGKIELEVKNGQITLVRVSKTTLPGQGERSERWGRETVHHPNAA